MAEYVMGPDDNQQEVAQRLMEHAGPERAHEIAWYPRPNVPGGGVFSMPDDLASGFTSGRLSKLDDDAQGDQINLATDGTTAEQRDPTQFNDALAAGRAPIAASPATGPNPVAHFPEREVETAQDQKPTSARARRQQAKAGAAEADTKE